MYNYYREHWLIDRLAGTAADGIRARPVRRHIRRCASGRHRRDDEPRTSAAGRHGPRISADG